MTSFGAALRQAREQLGLSTQDVALRTKIRGDYLRALEDGNLSLLPERTFTRSYLTRYARELGLDPQPLLQDFDRTSPAPAGSSQSARPVPRRRRVPVTLIAALLGGLLIVGASGYLLSQRATRPAPVVQADPAPTPAPAHAATVRLTVKVTPPGARVYLDNRDLGSAPILAFPVDARTQAELRVELSGREPLRQAINVTRSRNLRVNLNVKGKPSVLTDAAAPAPRPASAQTTTRGAATPGQGTQTTPAQGAATDTRTPAAAPATPSGVQVSYSGPAWTRVTDASGRILFEGTPTAGTVKSYPKGVTIRTGNAAAVKVSVDGAPGAALGQAGQVVTRSF
ncbi:RodZ domain-containing protein [Deinococcus radiotolerans]|uniref:RodZ domain-containing protein n=1 Tax=Deinococcus radiotolerans TaxID=1309407 RepID=UPI00166A684F|nr:RodZ domain-containing protein [Deinococcus radiotolerans]